MRKIYTALATILFVACSDSQTGDPSNANPDDECKVEVSGVVCTDTMRASGRLQPFSAPSGKSGISVTANSDAQARSGIPYTSVVDGWEITFSSIVLTVDHIQLVASSGDTSEAVVAEARGPFAVDVLKPTATLAVLSRENLVCNTPALESKTYGFSYDVVKASYCAQNVNLTGGALTAYDEMVGAGYSVMFSGEAVFKGLDGEGAQCEGHGIDAETYEHWPKTVSFRFGTTQALKAANCAGGARSGAAAEITVRSHLLFASALADTGTEYYFDQIAARYATGSTTSASSKVEDFSGQPFSPFSTLAGEPLTWRSCSTGGAGSDELSFDANTTIASDYAQYLQQALVKQLRFNNSSVCEIRPPSPEVSTDDPVLPEPTK